MLGQEQELLVLAQITPVSCGDKGGFCDNSLFPLLKGEQNSSQLSAAWFLETGKSPAVIH